MNEKTAIGLVFGFILGNVILRKGAHIGGPTKHRITFKDEMVGYSHGQADMRLIAYVGNEIAGILDYSEYEKMPSVKMLEVPKNWRRQGIGTELLKKLQKLYPNTEIDLGYASAEGAALLKTIDRKFVPNKKYETYEKRIKFLQSEYDRIINNINKKDDRREFINSMTFTTRSRI